MPNPYSLVLRNDKGSALTHTELDDNFRYLDVEVSGSVQSVTGNIVDNSDVLNPIVSGLNSVTGGTKGSLIYVDSTGTAIMITPTVNTNAGDSATMNTISGRFRKDNSGNQFTLNNTFITSNSIIIFSFASSALSTVTAWVAAGNGSAVFTFQNTPPANLDINFFIIN